MSRRILIPSFALLPERRFTEREVLLKVLRLRLIQCMAFESEASWMEALAFELDSIIAQEN